MSTTCSKDYILTVNHAITVAAYYTLDSAQAVTGDLIDMVSGLHMVKQAGVASPNVPALISNGLQRTLIASTTYTTGNVATLAYPNTGGWSLFGWFRINSNGAVNVGSELTVGVGNGSLFLDLGNTTNPQNLEVSWTDAGFQSVQTYLPISTGAWHFFHIYYDQVAQQVGISFDNGAATLTGVGVSFTVAPVGLLNFFGPAAGSGVDVTWDEMGLRLDRKLTGPEQVLLWNGGFGRTWPL